MYDEDIITHLFGFVKNFLWKIILFVQEKLFGIKFLTFSRKNFFRNFGPLSPEKTFFFRKNFFGKISIVSPEDLYNRICPLFISSDVF